MKKLFIIYCIFHSIVANGQIYNAYELKDDSIQYAGNLIKLPAHDNVIHHDYLIELDASYHITNMTLDIATSGIEVYGYSVNEDGQFHLLLVTNSNDQIYYISACVQYILVRVLPGVWQSVNIDFDMK